MSSEARDAVKKSVAVDSATYEFVERFARDHGINYTAAINALLNHARREIEREERVNARREEAYAVVADRLASEEVSQAMSKPPAYDNTV